METSKIIIEAIGYIGSSLVLISFLMVSVFKLRVVNSIGSIIFTIYAFIIHSYPTAIMNICLVLINIYYLIKMSRKSDVEYAFVKTDVSDSLLQYTIKKYEEDIKKCFPGISLDFSEVNSSFVICNEGKPAGILLGKRNSDNLEIVLDYSIPEYRDFSIGKFLFSKLPGEGIKTAIYRGADDHHKDYLEKTGFINKGGYYEKTLR